MASSPAKYYEATAKDSLASIAIKYNSTVSELKAINKLSTQLIFPGQKLKIPCITQSNSSSNKKAQPSSPIAIPSSKSTDYSEHHHLSSFEEVSMFEIANNQPYKSKSAVITAQPLPFSLPKPSPLDELTETYLRINAKYLTWSQGCVKGKLVLTPQSVMFEPLPLDPLVEDIGISSFEVILLMDCVIECMMTSDFSKFIKQNIDTSPHRNSKEPNLSNKLPKSPPGVFPTSPDISMQTFSSNVNASIESVDKSHLVDSNSNDSSSNISFNPVSGAIHFKPSNNQLTVSPQAGHHQTTNANSQKEMASRATVHADGSNIKFSTQANFLTRTNSPAAFVSNIVSKTKKVIRSNSGNILIPSDSNIPNLRKKDTIAAMNNRMRSISNPLPSQDDEDIAQPMFLRLLTEKVRLTTFESNAHAFLNKLVPILALDHSSSGKNSDKEEYWFAVPYSRIDTIYAFFLSWHNLTADCPLANTDVTSSNTDPLNDGSFSLKFKDNYFTDLGSSPYVILDDIEVIREKDVRKEIDSCPLPLLVGTNNILPEALLKELTYVLPSRTVGRDLFLVYSTFFHGISLLTMYRKMEDCDSPIIFIIRDDKYQLFGGSISCPLKISENHYGTGESFLFSFDQTTSTLKPYFWTGANSFFVKGDKDVIIFGGGNGKHAICLDGDFYHGSCHYSQTFGNPRLSESEDFLCSGFETWGFVS